LTERCARRNVEERKNLGFVEMRKPLDVDRTDFQRGLRHRRKAKKNAASHDATPTTFNARVA